ncbi:MAG: hypothetical protein VKP62_04690 [Candidatus Sericytochromatia bacterium]|nr:hypothetical protein [Candidatus Sericytochromatia bacterium]
MALLPDATAVQLESQFQAFLAKAYQGGDGVALLGMYHPEALISFAGETTRAGELDAEDFALLQAHFLERRATAGGDALAPLLAPPRLSGGRLEGPERAVLWFDSVEQGSGQAIAIGVGFALFEECWRVAWMTLRAAPQNWDFETGRAQAVSEFACAEAADLIAPRTWLDLSWYRQFGHPKPLLQVLPEAHFGCHGSGHCCDKVFAIDVDAGAQTLIDAIPWEKVHPPLKGTRLQQKDDGRLRLKGVGEVCRFLDEKRHCRIHTYLGRAVFPVCSQYPLRWTRTPDGVAITTSIFCGSARRRWGPALSERQADIHARMSLFPVTSSPPFRIEVDGADDWGLYREAEARVLAILARRDLTLDRRLWLSCVYLNALRKGQHLDTAALDAVAGPHCPNSMAQRLSTLEVVASVVADIGEGPLELEPDDPETEDVLTHACRDLIFSKTFLERYSLRTALNASAFMVILVRWLRRRQPAHRWTDDSPLVNAIGQISHGPFLRILTLAPHFEALLNSPDFVAWFIGPEPRQDGRPVEGAGETPPA